MNEVKELINTLRQFCLAEIAFAKDVATEQRFKGFNIVALSWDGQATGLRRVVNKLYELEARYTEDNNGVTEESKNG